jgi:hypothetical protein
MAATDTPDPILWAARRERARRWVGTDLRGYPAIDAEETEETLAAQPTPEQLKKGKPQHETS